ncbi:hypothetical protein [Methylobacterium oryzae]|uniref:Uncharacterized protein n=1 Tax=Methylobacterium oryzae TaxID=334852 RepID=A0ABU7TUE0_9HYPH
MGAVISFFRPASTSQGGWSQQELAEFYRVEAALIRAGLQIGSEQGLSDEAEPWFVFCRPDGDAIMHFARIDGSYVVASEVLDSPMRGNDFRALINQIAQRYPELLPIPQGAGGTKLSVHPAALLAALVAAAALSLSPDVARADDGERSAESASPDLHTGQTHQHGPTEARDTGDADERDSHRKQVGAIVFSAMVFAADAFAADHPEQGIEAKPYLGALDGISPVSGDQGSVPPTMGGAVGPTHSGTQLASGRHEPSASGASGSVTAEPNSVAVARSDATDFGTAGFRDSAFTHGPARTSLEPAFQTLTRAGEANTTRAAGSSSSPEPGSDGSMAASGSADPSSSMASEAASLTQSGSPTAGHAASEASPAPVNGPNAAAQPEPKHFPSSPAGERSQSPEYIVHSDRLSESREHNNAVADADPSGRSAGALERGQHGADGSGATAIASLSPRVSSAQVQADSVDSGHAQVGEGPGRSAEAPGHLKEAVAGPPDADGHGTAGGANPSGLSGVTQSQTSAADPGHTQVAEAPGRSADAPGHLEETASNRPDASSHGEPDSAKRDPAAGVAEIQAKDADPGHGQDAERTGQNAEAPGHLRDMRPHAQDVDGHGTGNTADPDSQPAGAQAQAGVAEPSHTQGGDGADRSAEAPGHLRGTGPHMQDTDVHAASANADPSSPPAAAQAEASSADPRHVQAGEGPGQSAEAPGHLRDTGPHMQDTDVHAASANADPSSPPAAAQAEASSADPGHVQVGEGPGQSAEAPGHLRGTGPQTQDVGGHGIGNTADPSVLPAGAQAQASATEPDQAEAGEGAGRSAEAPGHLQEAGPRLQDLDGHGTATGTNAGASASIAQGQAAGADSSLPRLADGSRNVAQDDAGGATNVGRQVTLDQPTARQGSEVSTNVNRDPAPSDHQVSANSVGSHAPPPAMSVDSNGDIVFSSDNKHSPSAGSNHPLMDGATSGDVGLIGISDHGTNAHHFDLHS